jgi:probable rRNA maturation factor
MSSRCRLSLAVQYASARPALPTRAQFRRWARAALESDLQIVLRIIDEPEARTLNKDFRGRDYATNVLAFPYGESDPLYGDIVICAPVVETEAREQGKETHAHYAHLTVHAVLHLQGHDHENAADAAAMEARETAILAGLGYADPYQL